ncbi:LacI family DNA-binding transcriptional regulator [Piscibacillus halophilus]|uniref:LacI family DNA-binding transcriptional regulator n=1 Tax=Piscibacillus halophilus TaxID=571933 RepID=UPI0015893CF8|nr:LacI family DNA-binding transcriptional regulator [Piscibacillus halophilus]
MQKVTIKDVARMSETSIRTVSRVINNHPNVKESTRERVQSVIKELDYKVNFLARGLKEQKTNQIVVFIDRRDGEYWGAYHNEVFQELHRLSKVYNYRMVISASSPDSFEDDDNDGFHLIKHKLCDGAIIFDPINNDQRVHYLKNSNTPFILIGDSKHDFDVSYVGVDNSNLGYLGAKSMFENGYKSMVFFLGKEKSIINQKRAEGFIRFCKEQGVNYNVYFDVFNLESAYNKTKEILTTQKVDSFFVSGDERALAVYRALHEYELEIGKEVGVLGIDNLRMSEYFYPTLSTIDQPKLEIAQSALNLLIQQITDEKHIPERRKVEPSLIKRQSL